MLVALKNSYIIVLISAENISQVKHSHNETLCLWYFNFKNNDLVNVNSESYKIL